MALLTWIAAGYPQTAAITVLSEANGPDEFQAYRENYVPLNPSTIPGAPPAAGANGELTNAFWLGESGASNGQLFCTYADHTRRQERYRSPV